MTQSEINAFGKIMRQRAAEFKNQPRLAKAFLIRAGIATKGGKFTKTYKNLCTPQDQD